MHPRTTYVSRPKQQFLHEGENDPIKCLERVGHGVSRVARLEQYLTPEEYAGKRLSTRKKTTAITDAVTIRKPAAGILY